jgi:predicted SprT family Zn-dependent metalloprotease
MLHLTPEMLEASYELLRQTPPFRRWKLPEPDEVAFRIIRSDTTRGTFHLDKGKPVISISSRCVGNIHSLNETMAHEMVHLYEDTVHKARGDVMHSSKFKALAKQVCKHHGFDELLF